MDGGEVGLKLAAELLPFLAVELGGVDEVFDLLVVGGHGCGDGGGDLA